MARKPDRFERTVEKAQDSFEALYLDKDQIVKLLRRQHRAYIRLVRKVWDWKVWDWQGEQLADNEDVCEVIIRELKRYAK